MCTLLDHFRTELHYSLLDPHINQTINGSCIFFFSVDDEENASVSYEIDNCTHDEIFPQNEKGSLRIGENGPDFWDWTQKDVVATDTFEINWIEVLSESSFPYKLIYDFPHNFDKSRKAADESKRCLRDLRLGLRLLSTVSNKLKCSQSK